MKPLAVLPSRPFISLSTFPFLFVVLFTALLATLFAVPGFAYYSEPPHNEVRIANEGLVYKIKDIYAVAQQNQAPTINSPFYYANGSILAVFPSIDGRISNNKTAAVLFVYAAKFLDAPYSERVVTNEYCNPGGSMWTFISILSQTNSTNIVFTYRNLTRSVPVATVSSVTVPFSEQELANDKSEIMRIAINGTFSVTYQRFSIVYEGSAATGCPFPTESLGPVTFNKSFYHEVNYTVETGNVLHFLASPVLREQWYNNNRFNSAVASKRRFYSAGFSVDGGSGAGGDGGGADIWANATVSLRAFNITTDKYGVESIVSFYAYNSSSRRASAREYPANRSFVPSQLQKTNESFDHSYEFNFSYAGIGRHSLSLLLKDDFGNSYRFEESILSRKLSAGNLTEGKAEDNGPNNENVRGSVPPLEQEFQLKLLAGGVLFAILAIVALRRNNGSSFKLG